MKVSLDLSNEELLVLLRHDTRRVQPLAGGADRRAAPAGRGCRTAKPVDDDGDRRALASALRLLHRPGCAATIPPSRRSVLTLPSEADIAQEIGSDVDPDAIHRARSELRRRIGSACASSLQRFYDDACRDRAPTAPTRPAPDGAPCAMPRSIFSPRPIPAPARRSPWRSSTRATNMTDRLAALSVLDDHPRRMRARTRSRDFGERYRDEPLVLDKWFTLQATIPEAGTLDARRSALMEHPAFSLEQSQPRALAVGSFAMLNQTQFNRADGAGYRFLAAIVLRVDELNPQLAARLLTAFSSWRMMESGRREHARSRPCSRIAAKAQSFARRRRYRAALPAVNRAIAKP